MSKPRKAFTLIELLVVIAIIGILATISVIALSNARAKARDAKRIGDAKQTKTALEMFFNDQNRFPTEAEFNSGSLVIDGKAYMVNLPTAPNPPDGICDNSTNQFVYDVNSAGTTFTLSYCLGGPTGSLSAGLKCITRDGFLDTACSGGSCTPSCTGKCSGESDSCGSTCPYPCTSGQTCSTGVCSDPLVCGVDSVTYEGGPYGTVQIGTQCWLTKNLNVGTMVTRTTTQTNNGIFEKHCYANTLSNCTEDGGLYQWAEAVIYENGATNSSDWSPAPTGNVQGLCPSGWHIPSDTEWYTLADYLTANGYYGVEATALKAVSPIWNGDDHFGFNILPAGEFVVGGSDHFQGEGTSFWSSSIVGEDYVRINHFRSDQTSFNSDAYSRASSYSIRCLRD